MFLVIVVIKNTLEKLYLTNVHMKQNSQSVSPLSILVPRSLVPYHRTNDTTINVIVSWAFDLKEKKGFWWKADLKLHNTFLADS
jgi:hypothetical protein